MWPADGPGCDGYQDVPPSGKYAAPWEYYPWRRRHRHGTSSSNMVGNLYVLGYCESARGVLRTTVARYHITKGLRGKAL